MPLSAMTRYLIPTTLLALIAALFITLRPDSNSVSLQANGQRQSPNPGMESTTTETGSVNNFRTKSKNRIYHPKPTIEDTVEILESTIIPKVDIQDQTLPEVTAALNTFIQDAGIPPHKLKVVINNSELFAQWRIRELRIRNVPLSILLKYVCDSSTLRYRIEPGIITILHVTEVIHDSPEIEKPNAPIDLPFDPDDPFSGTPDQGSDPFAEPEVPSQP